ncbi:hypothetical protein IWQ62_002658 [Dispira parvispora]|uniref:A to I editase domain-containing protein n=1 Tax=Dispira parvispora TaxID=1520584 RepID=A0A9W8ATB9_9FUNG|nr:hypothetical protein IWQ62_002658 [Dispira parvispora]
MATNETPQWANQVAQACLTQFQSLPKKGKPTMREGRPSAWTVLAGVVLENPEGQFCCVALGTGLKCLPESRLTTDGNVLHDAHAEVVARRSFLRYLYHQVQAALDTYIYDQSIFVAQESSVEAPSRRVLKLRNPAYKFHFYTSKIPCGDASMDKITQYDLLDAAKLQPNEQGPSDATTKQDSAHQAALQDIEPVTKKRRITNQVNHCLPFCRGRDNPHCLTALRTKPARKDAERTTSMSCSDKLMLWNAVGIQSALLSFFIEPIFLESVVIGEPFNHDAVAMALGGRLAPLLDDTAPIRLHKPKLVRATVKFPFQEPVGEDSASVLLSDSAIGWYYGSRESEVIVNGRRQGAVPDKQGKFSLKCRSRLCKRALWEEGFLVIFRPWLQRAKTEGWPRPELFESESRRLTYRETKQLATEYFEAKTWLYTNACRHWVRAPVSTESFIINDDQLWLDYICNV